MSYAILWMVRCMYVDVHVMHVHAHVQGSYIIAIQWLLVSITSVRIVYHLNHAGYKQQHAHVDVMSQRRTADGDVVSQRHAMGEKTGRFPVITTECESHVAAHGTSHVTPHGTSHGTPASAYLAAPSIPSPLITSTSNARTSSMSQLSDAEHVPLPVTRARVESES